MSDGDGESALMSGQTVADAPTSMTVEDLVDAVSDSVAVSVVAPLSARLDALEGRLDSVAGRAQVDGLSERVDALSGAAVTRDDLSSLSAQVEQATLQAGEELGPVGEEIGSILITLVGDLVSSLDSDGDGSSDVVALVSDIRTDVQSLSASLVHPALTTNFADYSVSEGLLLFLLLFHVFKMWVSTLEDGFSWLR